MDRDRLASMFKTKADELTDVLLARFPGRLAIAARMERAMPARAMFDSYIKDVHEPFGDRIAARDETFFMTAQGGEFDDPVVAILRSLWGQLDATDHDGVWAFLAVFEKLANAAVNGP